MKPVEQIHANAARPKPEEKPTPQPTNIRRPGAGECDENGNWFPSVSSAGAAAVRGR